MLQTGSALFVAIVPALSVKKYSADQFTCFAIDLDILVNSIITLSTNFCLSMFDLSGIVARKLIMSAC